MKRGTIDHPKMLDLARRLDAPLYVAVGLMECLWHWVAVYAVAGDVGRYSNELIAAGLRWNLNNADRLIDALTGSRWLDESDEHRLVVHDWPSHCEDAVHRKLARGGCMFADGSRPNMSRLTAQERKEVEALYVQTKKQVRRVRPTCAQRAPNVRPQNAQRAPEMRPAEALADADALALAKASSDLQSALPPNADCRSGGCRGESLGASASALGAVTQSREKPDRENAKPTAVADILPPQPESLVDRFVAQEQPEARRQMRSFWERRLKQMAAVPGGEDRCWELLNELDNRADPRLRDTKGFNGAVVKPSAWLNKQTAKWLAEQEEVAQ